MLSQKVDLTANHDFGASSLNGFFLEDMLVSTEYEGEYMTADEYEAIRRWERLFGKRRHPQQKRDLFPDKETKHYHNHGYVNGVKYCERCGKPIRVPWKVRYDLCPDCDERLFIVLDSDHKNERIPWMNGETDRRVAYNLFNLR